MNKITKINQILSLIETALPSLQIELEKGDLAVDSQKSLLLIKSRLGDMAQMLRSGSISLDPEYKGSMGHLVIDTWPLNYPLGTMITTIEYEFYRLGR